MNQRFRPLAIVGTLCFVLTTGMARADGRIAGRVEHEGGEGATGVAIELVERGESVISDAEGRYSFDGIRAGNYTLQLTLAENARTETGVVVVDGQTSTVDFEIDWPLERFESITIYSASRRVERYVDAPASASVLGEQEIQLDAAHFQAPKLLDGIAGVDTTQSGLYDFNFNVRGFNNLFNNRVLTLIDGRDASMGVLAAQLWGTFPVPLDEISTIEVVRGAGSALYGAGAFNGVLDIRTKDPRYSPGGRVQFTAGGLGTGQVDFRQAGEFGGEWYYRIHGGYVRSRDFARSRNLTVEYAPDLLPREAVPLEKDRNKIGYTGARFDKYLVNGGVMTFDVTLSRSSGPMNMGGAARAQLLEGTRPSTRFEFRKYGWTISAYYDALRGDVLNLGSGVPFVNDSDRFHTEVRDQESIAGGAMQLSGGVSYRYDRATSKGADGRQTLIRQATSDHELGGFGQADWTITERLHGVLAARVDGSRLHSTQFSPKAALVYSVTQGQRLRLTYGWGFLSPNIAEFQLRLPVAPPLDLSGIEAALGPVLGGVSLGFDSVPILAVGNSDLEVERIRSLDVGYTGIIGNKALLTVDLYRNELRNFITELLPQFGTGLGRINSQFGPYKPPSELSPQQAAIVESTLAGALPLETLAVLSNDFDGSPILAVASYTNYGAVNTRGADVALTYHPISEVSVETSYSWFEFDTRKEIRENPLLGNTARNRVALGMRYVGEPASVGLRYRWTEGHDWAAGAFRGPVPSYGVIDLNVAYRVGSSWGVGLNVTNLLNNEHYEVFGGDVIGRRLLGSINHYW